MLGGLLSARCRGENDDICSAGTGKPETPAAHSTEATEAAGAPAEASAASAKTGAAGPAKAARAGPTGADATGTYSSGPGSGAAADPSQAAGRSQAADAHAAGAFGPAVAAVSEAREHSLRLSTWEEHCGQVESLSHFHDPVGVGAWQSASWWFDALRRAMPN